MNLNEKNEIDSIFLKGLKGHEVSPSLKAREQFLNNLNKSSKKNKRWYFSLAASILFIAGFGWFIMNSKDTNPVSSNQLSQLNTPKKESMLPKPDSEPKKEVSESKAEVSNKKTKHTPKIAIIEKKRIKNNIAIISPAVEKENKKTELINRSATGVIETDELIPDELTLALQKAEERRNTTETPQITKENPVLFQKSIGESLVIETTDFKTFEDIYIPSINSDSRISLEEASFIGEAITENERSFIAKVYTEIKHLKHGEKLDLNSSAGTNTIASNKDSFIGHESMQIRQKYNWIKDRISRK